MTLCETCEHKLGVIFNLVWNFNEGTVTSSPQYQYAITKHCEEKTECLNYERETDTKMTDMKHLEIAFSSLEAVCRGRSCSECPLEPYDTEQYCAFTLLKDRLENLKEPMEEEEN